MTTPLAKLLGKRKGNESNKKETVKVIKKDNATITITFGDQAENHVGMEKLGNGLAEKGFTVEELKEIKKNLEKNFEIECELIDLNVGLKDTDIKGENACILIVRNGVNLFLNEKFSLEQINKELVDLDWDSKAKMYGRIVQKHARHNLCFADYSQEPNYEIGKGRIVCYSDLPCLSLIRDKIGELNNKAKNLFAEGNLYYDVRNCGIGYHGDAERKIVVALRLGMSMPLHYQWFCGGSPVGTKIELILNNGDLYIMSEKATGFDWKKKKIPTLRHAAGCPKYTTVPVPKSKGKKEEKKEKEKKKKKKE